MYPSEFTYREAQDVEDAAHLLNEHPDAELLAGGHSLLPTLKSGLADPEVLIDIGNIDDLDGIEVTDDTVSIGGLTRYVDVMESEPVQNHAPTLAEAAAAIGDIQVRNMGTIGGNLAHSDPAADLPGAILASDATLVAHNGDRERQIKVDDFFHGIYTTALEDDEVLTRVEIPRDQSPDVGSYEKKPSSSSGYALVGVAVSLWMDNETVTSARVAANGAMDHAVHLDAVEEAVTDRSLTEDVIENAASRAGDTLDVAMMLDDNQASNRYRAELLQSFTRRALTTAADKHGAN